MEWVSIKEKYPEKDKYVLCCDHKDLFILKFTESESGMERKKVYYFTSSCECEYYEGITHWMPLPKHPLPETANLTAS